MFVSPSHASHRSSAYLQRFKASMLPSPLGTGTNNDWRDVHGQQISTDGLQGILNTQWPLGPPVVPMPSMQGKHRSSHGRRQQLALLGQNLVVPKGRFQPKQAVLILISTCSTQPYIYIYIISSWMYTGRRQVLAVLKVASMHKSEK